MPRRLRHCAPVPSLAMAVFIAVTWIAMWSILAPGDETSFFSPRYLPPNDVGPNRSVPNGGRRYEIREPRSIGKIDVEDDAVTVVPGVAGRGGEVSIGRSPEEAEFAETFRKFVRVGPDKTLLLLGDEPFFVVGFNNYYVSTRAAWLGDGRAQVDRVLHEAEALGLNVLRCWAFADGDEWNALQPEAGVIDAAVFRDGLDYVVTEARRRNIRLILTLTNGKGDYGGMEQYVNWNRGKSITEFYTNGVIKDMFKDYVYTVLHRKNSMDGVLYKDNPTILGWDIANEPTDPGHPGSQALQDWIKEMTLFLKTHDPNHLVMIGWEGFFGDSTPERTKYNAYLHNFAPLSHTSYRHDDVCFGTDFYLNHLPETIDLCVAHLYPDSWTSCDHECEMQFAKNWIRQHLQVAAALGRPFLLGEFGKQKPVEYRNEFYSLVHSELLRAARLGYPVAGSLLWMLMDEDYPDYDGFGIYTTEKGWKQPRPPPPLISTKSEASQTMWNEQSMMQCLLDRAQTSRTDSGMSWNEGNEETLHLVSEYVQEAKTILPEVPTLTAQRSKQQTLS